MRNRGITFKLFVMTAIFFICFYGAVILSQLLFFDSFYQQQKVSGVEKHLKSFGLKYVNEKWGSSRISREAARFMLRNKTQLAIITLDGKMKLDDPFHIKMRQDDGKVVIISLSLFMNQYGEELKAADIQQGDLLTVQGEVTVGQSSSVLMYPVNIKKMDSERVGGTQYEEMIELSGIVTEVFLPDLKVLNLRQGILFEALEEWFPLAEARTEQLKGLELQKEEWTDSWSGNRNVIMIQPVQQRTGEIELLFAVTSLQEVKDMNQALRWFYLYLGIGGLILILILSLVFSKMVARPLITLNEMAKRMLRFDFTGHTLIRQKDELGSLSNSMFTLSRNLDKALRELKGANRQLVEDVEEKQRMKIVQQDFFANASHELKTPLSIIKGFAEGLEDGVSAGKQEHYVSVIIEEAGRMEELLKNMLDLAKLESGEANLRRSWFVLSELTEKVTDKLFPLLKKKQLEAVIIPSNELLLYADIGWIEQVLLNFMANAIRHAEEGSTITIEITGHERTTVFSIRNRGEIIPADQLEQVWERFYRVEPSRNRQTGGIGLGLSIAKYILDMHGYRYAVENMEDGVKFTVIFEN
ncbi:sensor histidine kinase [Paenibacillus donghaensis]|uniref:histidine kinase n=1 Tax=Paenibacillus donghaensis TaxID=414771 RepID=A0A2Z2KDT2_9BACL|nr:histidine kinase dimerization/phospho-acceptor domain-containing protein [Paenibacillus donghaensis]ASA20149.1 two-component sensor histidine kinase [Paenibacillus donghaensis]